MFISGFVKFVNWSEIVFVYCNGYLLALDDTKR